MKKYSKGFTLIELLVVIAIIGILSSVVLASLNTARTKGVDAAIKSNIQQVRTQAEMSYDAANNYTNVCASSSSQISGAAKQLLSTNTVGSTSQAFVYNSAGGTGSAVCHDSSDKWAVIVSLKGPAAASSGWCVDSSGAAKEVTTLTAGSFACGL